MNIAQAQFNMIEQQIRPWGVLDDNILSLLKIVPRRQFVPAAYQSLAFADITIPLAHQQVILSPKIQARMVQSAAVQSSDRVLEIGTGSGYVTALLAKLAHRVDSVDIFAEFTQQAQAHLQACEIDNVTFSTADVFSEAYSANKQLYDVIICSAGLCQEPTLLLSKLTNGGRLFAFLGTPNHMSATVFTRQDKLTWQQHNQFETVAPYAIHAPQLPTFTF